MGKQRGVIAMKSVSRVVDRVFPDPSDFSSLAQYVAKPSEPKPLIDEGSARVINALFAELKAVHPAWRHAWPDKVTEDAAKVSWTKAFTAAGMRSIEQIRFGIERCRQSGSPFMPSVGQFMDWCRPTPENMGLPSTDSAYLQACAASHPAADTSDLHPAVWHAACETGLFLLANQPESRSRPVFERAYAMTVELILQGEPLREIPKALPAKVTKPKNLEAGNAALSALKRKVSGVAL